MWWSCMLKEMYNIAIFLSFFHFILYSLNCGLIFFHIQEWKKVPYLYECSWIDLKTACNGCFTYKSRKMGSEIDVCVIKIW